MNTNESLSLANTLIPLGLGLIAGGLTGLAVRKKIRIEKNKVISSSLILFLSALVCAGLTQAHTTIYLELMGIVPGLIIGIGGLSRHR